MPPHRDMLLDMNSGVGGRKDVNCSASVGGGGGVDAVGVNTVAVVEVEK